MQLLNIANVFAVVGGLLIASTRADITGSHPSAGSCLCAAGSSVNLTDTACGSVIGRTDVGQCFRYSGRKESCSLVGRSYEFFQVDSSDNAGWIDGTSLSLESTALRFGSASSCRQKALTAGSNCPTIISRSQWGARQPKSTTNIAQPVPRVFIHHTETPPCDSVVSCSKRVRSIQDYHMDEKHWDDIGYNFLVGGDGNVYEGRGWDFVGAHVKNYNSQSIGISMIGSFDSTLPNGAALAAAQQLISCGVQLGKLSASYTLHGHRDGACTTCPGQRLYDLVRTWPHYGGQLPGHC